MRTDASKWGKWPTMNTRLTYMYRDAGNYKFYQTVVVAGSLNAEDLQANLHEYDYFIPCVVGLDDLQPSPTTVDDHIWHEIVEIGNTDDPPTIDISLTTLLFRFHIAKELDWMELEVLSRVFEL